MSLPPGLLNEDLYLTRLIGSDRVWRSPQGVVVRMRKHGKELRFAELVYEGEVMATRVEDGLRIRAGDVEVTPSGDGYEVRIKKKAGT